jgi:hypothetical protein
MGINNIEIWKGILDYEESYQVSNHGRIKSLDRYIRNGINKERFIKGQIRKLSRDKYGYLYVNLNKEGKRKTYKVHRLVLTAFDRPPKEGEECNHGDGNKGNNYKSNLEWCTPKENCDHRDNILDGNIRGERNNFHKLIEKQVREIRNLCKGGKLTQKQIAIRYNVCTETISRIKLNKNWGHIK